MEKPVTVDGPTTRKMLKLAEESKRKNLKVGVGLMVRHCRGRQELLQRIRDGEIGEIVAMRGYRMSGRSATTGPKPCSWMKGAWPVEAQALGGRHYRGDSVDQNFDTYSIEYTYPDGSKLFYNGRNMSGCKNAFASFAHGTKGSAVISTSGHSPGKVRTYKGQNMDSDNLIWRYPQPERSPYQLEWDDLIERGRTRRHRQPRDVHGPHGRPHGQRRYLRPDAQLRARACPQRRQSEHGFARAAQVGCRGQVSCPIRQHHRQ